MPVTFTTTLTAPTLDSVDTSVEDEITISWTKNDDNSTGNYEVYRSLDGTLGSLIATITNLSTTSYTDTGLSDGEKYYYTVRRNTDDGASADSNQESGITILPAPSNLAYSSFTLSWTDNSDNEDGFYIYRKPDGGTWSQIASVGSNTTSYTVTSPGAGKYHYRVDSYTEHSQTQTSTTVSTVFEAGSMSGTTTVTQSGAATATTSDSGTMAGTATFTTTESGGSTTESGVMTVSATASATDSTTTTETGNIAITAIVTPTAEAGNSTEALDEITISSFPRAAETITGEGIATVTGDGEAESDATLIEVFPSQSSADLDFTLVTQPALGFMSNWVYEEAAVDNPEAYTVVLDIDIYDPLHIYVQYDADGNGTPDYTAGPYTVDRNNQTISIDELGDDGYYRLLVSHMDIKDYLHAVTWGPTRF